MPTTVFTNPIFPGAKVVTAELTVTNTSGSYSNTVTDSRIVGSMKPYALEIGDPSVFNDKISITTNAGSYTVACSDVAGETTIKISFLKIDDDPTAVTSTEFDILANRIGTLENLTTTEKTNLVDAVNEVKGAIPDVVNNLTSDSTTSALSAAQGKVLNGAIPAVVNNLTSDSTTSALSAAQGKTLSDQIGTLNSNVTHEYISTSTLSTPLDSGAVKSFEKIGKNIYITMRGDDRAHTENETFMVLPSGYRPGGDRCFPIVISSSNGGFATGIMKANGDVQIWSSNPPYGRIIIMLSYAAD